MFFNQCRARRENRRDGEEQPNLGPYNAASTPVTAVIVPSNTKRTAYSDHLIFFNPEKSTATFIGAYCSTKNQAPRAHISHPGSAEIEARPACNLYRMIR